jgi:hypothetical protein
MRRCDSFQVDKLDAVLHSLEAQLASSGEISEGERALVCGRRALLLRRRDRNARLQRDTAQVASAIGCALCDDAGNAAAGEAGGLDNDLRPDGCDAGGDSERDGAPGGEASPARGEARQLVQVGAIGETGTTLQESVDQLLAQLHLGDDDGVLDVIGEGEEYGSDGGALEDED